MRKSDRLFQLTNILRAHQPVTAEELSERLSVSVRTIYRYMDDLSLAGVPVYGEAGVGYRLSEGFELPPLQLNEQELEALIVGVNMVSSWTGPSLSEASQSLLSKIEAALPSRVVSSDQSRTVRIPGAHEDSTCWEELHSSIQAGQWVQIQYRSLSDKVSTRVVYPLGLFFWGGKWTLGSWCSLRAEYRDFRVDRVEDLSQVTGTATLPETVSLKDYMDYQKNQSSQNTADTTLSGASI